MRLTWDDVGAREYETGVDHGVLYVRDDVGNYDEGVPWNGLVTVTESPSGAEPTPTYADNIKYLNLISAEELGGTIEAYTYPDDFAVCDGTVVQDGVVIGQQNRKTFGLAYRTLVGNDVDGTDHGYKLHLLYGALAAPSEKAYGTVNDSPEAITFSWDFSTTGVAVDGFKPVALLIIDSTDPAVDPAQLADLEDIIWGEAAGGDARLPLPQEVLDLFSAGGATEVDMDLAANAPTFVNGTGVITLPVVAGIQWKVNGVNKVAGAQPAIGVGDEADVEATPLAGYTIDGDNTWTFERV